MANESSDHLSTPLPAREVQAYEEIGQTRFSRGVSAMLVVTFLVFITLVPVIQLIGGWSGVSGLLTPFRGWRGAPAAIVQAACEGETSLDTILTANAELQQQLRRFEDTLDEETWLSRWARPRVQRVLYRLGNGNEQVFLGSDGWLFYEPALRSLTGSGFLDPAQLQRRRRAGEDHADPRPAILALRDDLQRRGIALVLMPAPTKASCHPHRFSSSMTPDDAPLHNRSWRTFHHWCENNDIPLYDCTADLLALEKPAFLRMDTHWTPEGMGAVASGLARFLTQRQLMTVGDADYRRGSRRISNYGDIARMLTGVEGGLLQPEEVAIEPVFNAADKSWTAQRSASILILGDSYTNIYSLAEMGWGGHAGLAEQLACQLQQPVDIITENDGGAHATRRALAKALHRGEKRLAGKRVVIWQFAARELAVGSWSPVSLPADTPITGSPPHLDMTGATRIRGTVRALSEDPSADAVYQNFIMKAYVDKLRRHDGRPFRSPDAVVLFFGKRDGLRCDRADVRIGQEIDWTLRSWAEVESRYGRLKSGALDDVMLEITKPLYWAIAEP